MERVLQYMDDLDDLIYAIALTWERIRTFSNLTLYVGLMAVCQVFGIYAAMEHPPLAVAGGSLLVVALMYRGAVLKGPALRVFS